MTRLARRNRTRRIKLWKRRGYLYRHGKFWKSYTWNIWTTTTIFEGDEYAPY